MQSPYIVASTTITIFIADRASIEILQDLRRISMVKVVPLSLVFGTISLLLRPQKRAQLREQEL